MFAWVTKKKYDKLQKRYDELLEDCHALEEQQDEDGREIDGLRQRDGEWEEIVRRMGQRMTLIRCLATAPGAFKMSRGVFDDDLEKLLDVFDPPERVNNEQEEVEEQTGEQTGLPPDDQLYKFMTGTGLCDIITPQQLKRDLERERRAFECEDAEVDTDDDEEVEALYNLPVSHAGRKPGELVDDCSICDRIRKRRERDEQARRERYEASLTIGGFDG